MRPPQLHDEEVAAHPVAEHLEGRDDAAALVAHQHRQRRHLALRLAGGDGQHVQRESRRREGGFIAMANSSFMLRTPKERQGASEFRFVRATEFHFMQISKYESYWITSPRSLIADQLSNGFSSVHLDLPKTLVT